jgi:SulP family sulfate permease
VHAMTVLAVMLVAAPLAFHVPLAALAAILMHVAWNMGDWKAFSELRNFSPQYRTILLATFLLTVVVDLTVAVEIGLVLAGLFFIMRVASLTSIEPLAAGPDGRPLPAGVVAYRVQGSLFFGSVSKLDVLSESVDPTPAPRAMVLDLRALINMDTTAIDAMEDLHRTLALKGTTLIVCGAQAHPRSLIERSRFDRTLGEGNLQPDLAAGLERATELLTTA